MSVKYTFWLISLMATVVFVFFTVKHLSTVNASYKPDSSQLTDLKSVETYLDGHWERTKTEKKQYYVPTGIYISSIQWVNPHSIFISGYVWQKYDHAYKGKVSQGFTLPEVVELKKNEIYRFSDNTKETIGWQFEGKIIQRFDYANYPFDHKTIKIRIWHEDFDDRAINIPDFKGYDSTRPEDTFGIDKDIALAGYDILESFFAYQNSRYDANFGYESSPAQQQVPELYFNVVLKRHAIEALIIYVLPLLLVFVLCFFSILSNTFDEKKRDAYNFHYLEILTECAALFFVVLLAHIHMREVFSGVDIIYLEYIYVLSYLAILYVTLNSFLVVHAELSNYAIYRLIRYEDNLLPKVLFLPLFSGITLAIALVFF